MHSDQLWVCAIAKNETRYLVEWVSFHRLVGADRILIYDNGHDDEGQALLSNLNQAGFATVIPWFESFSGGPQLPAYEDCLQRARGKTQWVLFIDIDEFAVPIQYNSIRDFLAVRQNADAIWIPWLIFGSSGANEYHPSPVIQRFTNRQTIDIDTITPVKSLVRPEKTVSASLHVHEILTNAYEDPTGQREFVRNRSGNMRAAQRARGYDIIRIHHYMVKSRSEWIQKVSRGRADRGFKDQEKDRSRSYEEFVRWNRNEVVDESALRYLTPLKAEIRELEKIVKLS